MLGNLLDEYIEGNFYVGNNEKIPPEKLELAPLIERIAETKLFLNNDGIPMSKSTLTKMAEKMWQKDKRVRHNEKHKEKSPYRKDRNQKDTVKTARSTFALTLTRPSQTSMRCRFLLCEATSFFMLWHELENVTNIIIN